MAATFSWVNLDNPTPWPVTPVSIRGHSYAIVHLVDVNLFPGSQRALDS